MKILKVLPFIFILLLPHSMVSADWVWSPDQGKFINTQEDTQSDAEDLFENALDLYKEKKLDKAVAQFDLIIKKYPKSRYAPEAEYRLGTIYEEMQDYVKAHKAYQSLIKSYPQSGRFEEVIEREYQLGTIFLSGKKGKMMGLEIRPSLPLAVEVFQKIVEAAPYGVFGDKSQFNVGIAYMRMKKYDEAVEAFQNLLEQYPKSELVQQARLQMTEASYTKSSAQTRDQSALDAASQQAQSYLQRYPDSADATKALEIRRRVDELNAEKNYRIGLYYEKDNYLESAVIYYRDTAKRYPETGWGKKAAEKLSILEEPVKYLNSKTDELQKELKDLEARYQALGKDNKSERARLEAEIRNLKKRIGAIDRNKAESLDRRKQDLKRREQELKEKFKELERKKKRYKNNTSEDFQKAIARWQASLEAERDALAEEREQLETWRSELGIRDHRFYENLIPFRGPSETPLEKIQQIDEKDFYKLSRKKKDLFEKKEKLYKRYSELQVLLTPERSESGLMKKRLRGSEKRDPSKPADPKLLAREKEIELLETKLEEKKADYEKAFGKIAELELEALLEKRAAGPAIGGAADLAGQDVKGKSLEELLVLKMHLNEKITTQQNIVQTLSTAFNKELAQQEQKQLLASLEESQDTDGRKLRKEIKAVEKQIRSRYQDIQDRHKRKTELLEELNVALQPAEDKRSVLKAVGKPVKGTWYLAKAFVFGLPHEDVELTRAKPSADSSIDAPRVAKLQEAVELESLMIEAQDLEIRKLEKEREILSAKASLAGGMKFRSSYVKVPYIFIEEAIQSARRIVPRKNRKDILLNRLDHQTRELEALKQQLDITETLIKEKTPAAPAPVPSETPSAVQASPEAPEIALNKAEKAVPEDGKGTTESEKKETGNSEEQKAPEEGANVEASAGKEKITAKKEKVSPFEEERRAEREAAEKEKVAEQEAAGRALREEIIRLQEQLEVAYSVYAQEQGLVLGDVVQVEKPKDAEGVKRYGEFETVKSELLGLIEEEMKIEAQEKEILEKRIKEAEKVLPSVTSKAMNQDIIKEKERMTQRIADLETRRDFLSKEKEHFSKRA